MSTVCTVLLVVAVVQVVLELPPIKDFAAFREKNESFNRAGDG